MATGDSFYEDEYLLSLLKQGSQDAFTQIYNCLLYTSDAADE